MSRKRRNTEKTPKQIAAILQSLVADWEKSNQTFSHMNLLPTRFGLGLVLDRMWMCVKCGNYQFEDLQNDLICRECKRE